jgi:hypothetical protein
MSGITAEEWQVLSFFEVEPTLRDSDVPWCYNDAVYEVERGPLSLSCAIAPSYRDVRIVLQYEQSPLYELNAMDVKDVRYVNEDGREELVILLTDRETVSIKNKPRLEIAHGFDNRP